jgi:hypothetical protein
MKERGELPFILPRQDFFPEGCLRKNIVWGGQYIFWGNVFDCFLVAKMSELGFMGFKDGQDYLFCVSCDS